MIKLYKRFLLQSFDYNSREDRKEFWPPFLIHILLSFIAFFIFIKQDNFAGDITDSIFVFILILIFIMTPINSAINRRVNDVGSDSKIKRIFDIFYLILSAIVMIIGIYYLNKSHVNEDNMFILFALTTYFGIKIIFLLWYCTLPSNFYKSNHELNHS